MRNMRPRSSYSTTRKLAQVLIGARDACRHDLGCLSRSHSLSALLDGLVVRHVQPSNLLDGQDVAVAWVVVRQLRACTHRTNIIPEFSLRCIAYVADSFIKALVKQIKLRAGRFILFKKTLDNCAVTNSAECFQAHTQSFTGRSPQVLFQTIRFVKQNSMSQGDSVFIVILDNV